MISPKNLWIWSYDNFIVKSTEAYAQAVQLESQHSEPVWKSYDPIKRVWHSEVPYLLHYCVSAQSLQLCLTLGNPMDCSPPGSSVHGILQGYWSGLPCPPPGDLPDLAIKPESLMSPALAGGFFTTNATWEALYVINTINKNNSLPFSCLWQICCPEPKKCLFPRKWQEGGYTPGHRGTSDWFWGLYIWPLVKSNKWLTDRLRTVPAMDYTWTT